MLLAALLLVAAVDLAVGTRDRDFCGAGSTLRLAGSGRGSSVLLDLVPPDKDVTQCQLRVIAPSTHVVYARLLEKEDRLPVYWFRGQQMTHSACMVTVQVAGRRGNPSWETDPCAEYTPEADGPLLPATVDVEWTVPTGLEERERSGQKALLFTALGKAEACESPEQHTCLRAGSTPIVCAAYALRCDGIMHCPPGSEHSDEDTNICALGTATSWERYADELLRQLGARARGSSGGLLPAARDNPWLERTTIRNRVTHVDGRWTNEVLRDPGEQVYSHHSFWGYLLVGVVVIGAALLSCGLWECCCRTRKPTTPRDSVPPVAIADGLSNATIDLGVVSTRPPSYEDLDQPPAYSMLFPGNKPATAPVVA